MSNARSRGFYFILFALAGAAAATHTSPENRPWIETRGVYGGIPSEAGHGGMSLQDLGVNAIFVGSGSITTDKVNRVHSQGARLFAEFNSMHAAEYLKAQPDAAPVGVDGHVCPPPEGWQGVCPTHPGYRKNRMVAFESLLRGQAVDGIWLDYHHSHANWERADPLLPDTCFCTRCIGQFTRDAGIRLPEEPADARSRRLLTVHREKWVQWRCDIFTGWVREYRTIIDRTRPGTLLGTYHCSWSDRDFGGARTGKLAIDLKAQARYVDVFSPMPYHARFGHSTDPAWVSRQVKWLGEYLGIRGETRERLKIWPIVQLSDWGERVPVEQVAALLDHGTRQPSTGVMVFAWGSLRDQPAKIEAMARFYKEIR